MARHKCKTRKLFLIEEIIDEFPEVCKSDSEVGSKLKSVPTQFVCYLEETSKTEISLNAITGSMGPKNIRFKRKIGM